MRNSNTISLLAIGASLVCFGMSGEAHAAFFCKTLAATSSTPARTDTQPMERRLRTLPKALFGPVTAVAKAQPSPLVVPSSGASIVAAPKEIRTPLQRKEPAGADGRNYGENPFGSGTNKDTIYHYTDNRVATQLMEEDPYRRVGHFAFVASDNGSYRCTASLIKPSIAVTAGHCIHDGGNKASGWIKSGQFHPGYNDGTSPYDFANAAYICTTSGWYNNGSLDMGYDVAIIVLHKRSGTSNQIGSYTGTFGFCYQDCLQQYWYLTQLGYPANYDSGTLMQEGQHLEHNRSDTDYYYGSGMQGGSSGGPHVANLGTLSDSTSDLGKYTNRNIVFAVTSWGYTDDSYKIQGASSLSGPGNSNDFKRMFNSACAKARALHGSSACKNL